jgi:hypothetical protein
MGQGRGSFRASKFVEYLNPYYAVEKSGLNALYINRRRLTASEVRRVWSWSNDEYKTVKISTVDAWATRFDLPLWEIEEAAKIAA